MMKNNTNKNNLLINSDLPNTNKTVETIATADCFPIASYTISNPWYWLDTDGALFQLFRLPDYDIKIIISIIRNMLSGSSLQIYRVKLEAYNHYYICIKVQNDIEELKSIKNLIKPGSAKLLYNHIGEKTERCINKISSIMSQCIPVNYQDDILLNSLCNYTCNNKTITLNNIIKTNLSIIKIGEEKYAGISSVQNIGVVPLKSNTLKDFNFIQVVSIIKPDKARNMALQSRMNENLSLIEALNSKEKTKREVHVDTIIHSDTDDVIDLVRNGLMYVNCSFMLNDKSITDLNIQNRQFTDVLNTIGIQLYNHSNSTRNQYISFFPGNAESGEHYYIAQRRFFDQFIFRTNEL